MSKTDNLRRGQTVVQSHKNETIYTVRKVDGCRLDFSGPATNEAHPLDHTSQRLYEKMCVEAGYVEESKKRFYYPDTAPNGVLDSIESQLDEKLTPNIEAWEDTGFEAQWIARTAPVCEGKLHTAGLNMGRRTMHIARDGR
eukprot:2290735-Amphidinium_carterae.1